MFKIAKSISKKSKFCNYNIFFEWIKRIINLQLFSYLFHSVISVHEDFGLELDPFDKCSLMFLLQKWISFFANTSVVFSLSYAQFLKNKELTGHANNHITEPMTNIF